jgi:hypothetical protein
VIKFSNWIWNSPQAGLLDHIFLFKGEKSYWLWCAVLIANWIVILTDVSYLICKYQISRISALYCKITNGTEIASSSSLFSQYEDIWDIKIHWKLCESGSEANSEPVLTSWHVKGSWRFWRVLLCFQRNMQLSPVFGCSGSCHVPIHSFCQQTYQSLPSAEITFIIFSVSTLLASEQHNLAFSGIWPFYGYWNWNLDLHLVLPSGYFVKDILGRMLRC